MKFFDKVKDRYNILTMITFILLGALTIRLASLTIANGDYYRELSDTKRIKEIHTTAPRGEIRDREGRVLAGNVPRFTVQLFKDEISLMDPEEKNDAILKLVRLLEEDGASYEDEYPLDFNVFKYNSIDTYINSEKDPVDEVVSIIVENNLLSQILDTYYINDAYEEHFNYITANSVLHALQTKGIQTPIDVKIEGNNVDFYYTDEEEVESWRESMGIDSDSNSNANAKSDIISLIDNDSSIIRTMLNHPIARELAFDIISKNNLQGNIILEEYVNTYEENYMLQKINLMQNYDEVTLETSAKEDFINIFKDVALENFLYQIYEDDEEDLIPGEILINLIEEKGEEPPVSIEINEQDNSIMYTYVGEDELEDSSPVSKLIEKSEELNILGEFLTKEEVKGYAQSQLLEEGVNPGISISTFEYAEINNLNDFYERNKAEKNSSIEEAFEDIAEHYEIDESLSKYEKRSILMIYHLLDRQGYLAYQPINIAYGIKDKTIAKVEEGLADYNGIGISIEPVRYYPEGQSAAHILGTLGRISQPHEVEEYVVEKDYSANDIIGKTGIEESFEDTLKGKDGIRKVEVDVVGNTTNIMDEVKPTPGDAVNLSIDLDVQKVAEKSLEQTLEKLQEGGTYESAWGNFKFGIHNRKGRPYVNATSGALVAIEVKTGKILAMTSYPAYDPNLFSTGISSSDWERLFPEDEDNPMAPRPLYNISTQTALQPGSTFKMVPALAALDKGMSPNTKIRDMGYITIGDRRFNNLLYANTGRTRGYLDLYEALEVSCNYYFYSLALGRNQRTNESIGVKLEIEDIINMSKQLGLNDKSGIEINVPAEATGGVPDPVVKALSTKNALRNMLDSSIENYIKEDVTLDDEEIQLVIDEILDWTEYEVPLTRGEVIQELDALGIDPLKILPNEREGLADKITFTYLTQAGWNITDTINVTIGQGQNAYTPIQMANYVATIANGGYRHDLTLIDDVKSYDDSETTYEYTENSERIELNDYNDLEDIKKGMKQVSDSGTASSVFANFPVDTGSKTGTAQRDGFDDFAWFVGFAPYDEPEIAVAALIFQGGSGGYAGPMVRDVMAEYLGLSADENDDSLPDNSSSNP